MRFCLFCFCFIGTLWGGASYYVCIDGGGSNTTVEVLDEKGKRIASGSSSCSNINTVGEEGIAAVFNDLFGKIEVEGTILLNVLSNCHVVAGLAGLGLEENMKVVRAVLEGYDVDELSLFTDIGICLELLDGDGIVLICGTGSICYGKKGGEIFRVGGLGKVLGDEGSCYEMGLVALKKALADEYGWGEATTLTPAFKSYFEIEELSILIPSITKGEKPAAEIAALSQIVFNQAAQKDEVAKEVLTFGASQIGGLLNAQLLLSKLEEGEVHFWGGAFKGKEELFFDLIFSFAPEIALDFDIFNMSQKHPAVLYVEKFLESKG